MPRSGRGMIVWLIIIFTDTHRNWKKAMTSTSNKTGIKVCIIGAGPSGLMALYRFLQLGEYCPEVTCFERQPTFGGQWNYSWKAGTDDYGERVHSSIYNNLWTNTPKEVMEIPEYTFDEHFGRPTPSFISLPVVKDYIRGIMGTCSVNMEDHIQYNTTVNRVQYHNDTDMFSVQTVHLPTGTFQTGNFSHVLVANGIYTAPFVPDIKGIETFPGLVLHSHSVKRSEMFRNQKVLIIGALFSAEDLSIHCVKYGAEHVIISYRTRAPPESKWPEIIEVRPMVTEITRNKVTFKDGSTAEVDIIVFCTGYRYHYPFLEDGLRLQDHQTSFYPKNLYKGVLWFKGGNQKLFFINQQRTVFSFPMYAVQGAWVVKYITGRNPINNHVTPADSISKATREEMEKECKIYQDKLNAIRTVLDIIDILEEYNQSLADELGYKIDFSKYGQMLKDTVNSRDDHVMSYRDDQYTSFYTKVKSLKPKIPWAQRFDDSLEEFLK